MQDRTLQMYLCFFFHLHDWYVWGFFCLFIYLFVNVFAHLLVFALFACFVFSFSHYKVARHFIAEKPAKWKRKNSKSSPILWLQKRFKVKKRTDVVRVLLREFRSICEKILTSNYFRRCASFILQKIYVALFLITCLKN